MLLTIWGKCLRYNRACFLRRIRASTAKRLRELAGGVLSRALRELVADDPVAPLLTEPHFIAMDRRLATVLHSIDSYIRSSSVENVLISDGYS